MRDTIRERLATSLVAHGLMIARDALLPGRHDRLLRLTEAAHGLTLTRVRRRRYASWSAGLQDSGGQRPVPERSEGGSRRTCLIALHMQPEAAVISAVSPWIEDQINLIHHVVDLLGEGWDILVKDHPAQAADPLFRSDLWVGSLSANPAITVLPPDVPSSDLLGSIDLAATIMGTIGWEAVRLGIPALVFGPAWYRQAPGVIEFREVSRHPCFDDALREAVARLQDPDALPRWLRQVSARLGVGYVGHLDTWRFEDDLRHLHTGSVDRESELRSNPRVVAESFLRIIDHELRTESARHSVR